MRSRLVGVVALAVLAAGCSSADVVRSDARHDDAITIGSFNFGESVLLGELYAQAIEARGIAVVREFDLGPREIVEPALEKGLLELVPEYGGSLLQFLVGGSTATTLAQVREELRSPLERRGLVALASAPAQNQNGFAVRGVFARALQLDALSDLAGADGLVLGGPPECPERRLCEPGLEGAYGIDFERFVPLDLSGPLTAEALARGIVDVALLFTTSAEIVRNGFVLLEDDRHLQPDEHVTPVVRADALDRFGAGLGDAVAAVSALLTTEELRHLNAEVELHRRSPAAVASEWLAGHGLVPAGG